MKRKLLRAAGLLLLFVPTFSAVDGLGHRLFGQETASDGSQESGWTLLSEDVVATVYNAVPAQCNDDVIHTASMFRIDTADVLRHRIIAMERTMMAELKISYGDTLKVAGTGRWDGLWQVQDTMNKRFAGQHRIDFLVPREITTGKWTGVRIYRPGTKTGTLKEI